jgi:hypothetical protein
MIENYTVNQETQEVSGIYNGEAFTLPPKVADNQLERLSEQECLEVLDYRAQANQLMQENTYKALRISAYPSIQDQLDTLYHGGYEAWKATITAVKEEFPKP